MQLPQRPRRLRANAAIRALVSETQLHCNNLIAPLFVESGTNKQTEIASMPGYFRYSEDKLLHEIESLANSGIKALLLFAKIEDNKKDKSAGEALNPNGLLPKTIRAIKNKFPEMYLMSDVALDPFSTFGHDGIVEDGKIVNDPSVEILAKMALLHAENGVDCVAPSDMMDGRVKAIRYMLEANGFVDTTIMSYSAKYASCFYGPFRNALDSSPGFGNKKTYQMDFANAEEALKEVATDIEEGADIFMIKPALAYLDIIYRIKSAFQMPVAAYQVSGEYSMIKAAAQKGWIDENQAIIETTTAIKRAGADMIATYFAKEIAEILKTDN